MDRQEMLRWASLLEAQARGEQLQFQPTVRKTGDPWPIPPGYWRDDSQVVSVSVHARLPFQAGNDWAGYPSRKFIRRN